MKDAENNIENLLVNTYFATMAAADILMRQIAYLIEDVDKRELKYELKQAHNLCQKAANDFIRKYDIYMDRVMVDGLVDKGDLVGGYDATRAEGNDIIRLLLYYADRCDTPQDKEALYALLRERPVKAASNEYIEQYKLK